MAGERQPGGRAPAPGELALVQAFINSHYDLELDHGAELLATPAALARWLRWHHLLDGAGRLSEADLVTMVEFRETLRRLASANIDGASGDPGALDRFAAGAPVEIRFDGGMPNVRGRGPGCVDRAPAGDHGAGDARGDMATAEGVPG
jgi:Putative stress-induced transcription regulator